MTESEKTAQPLREAETRSPVPDRDPSDDAIMPGQADSQIPPIDRQYGRMLAGLNSFRSED